MQFSDVIGQGRLKSELMQLATGGRLPHALLLLGKEGVGGLPLSLAFAQYIFCTDKNETDSCGVCAACQKIERLEHADLHITFPVFGSKVISNQYIKEFRRFVKERPYGSTFDWLQEIEAENKQGNITSEECEKVLENLSLKSYEGGYKIQIIWRPEYLGKEGNKLLKLIEEPPASTIMLFVAEEVGSILQTILSRTQLVRIPPVSAPDIAAALVSKGLVDTRRAAQIGQLAGGSYTEALALTEHVSNDLLPQVKDWFNALFTGNGMGLVQFAEVQAKEGREQQKQLLRFVLELLEGALRASYLPIASLPFQAEEANFINKLAGRRLSPETIKELTGKVSDTLYHIERNANAKMQLLALSIKMQQLLRVQPTAGVRTKQ